MAHIPVLQEAVLKYLDPKPGENFIDCTAGGGGHAISILEKTAPHGKLLGIDLDNDQISNLKNKISKSRLGGRMILANDNYANLEKIVRECKFKNISGILIDLGFSGWHIEESGRGFTFLKSEPLDMRYDLKSRLTAAKILNYWSESDLERIFREYGQEQFARQIAQKIIEARKVIDINRTLQLVEIVKSAVPSGYLRKGTHFATKTFQALRIAVNGELDNLKCVLPQTVEIMKSGGRLVIISFHSLEDKIVKDFFKKEKGGGRLSILTKKPLSPQRTEII